MRMITLRYWVACSRLVLRDDPDVFIPYVNWDDTRKAFNVICWEVFNSVTMWCKQWTLRTSYPTIYHRTTTEQNVSMVAINKIQNDWLPISQSKRTTCFELLNQHVELSDCHLSWNFHWTNRTKNDILRLPKLTKAVSRDGQRETEDDCSNHVILFHPLAIETMHQDQPFRHS